MVIPKRLLAHDSWDRRLVSPSEAHGEFQDQQILDKNTQASSATIGLSTVWDKMPPEILDDIVPDIHALENVV